MKSRMKIYLAVGLASIAFLLCVGLFMAIKNSMDTFNPDELLMGAISYNNSVVDDLIAETEEVFDSESIPVIKPTETPYIHVEKPIDSVGENKQIGEITIITNRKTKTYEIMQGVDDKTLKKNIGHLPSSSMPNEFGTCVLMGHRDTDFKILKYAEIGDYFYITLNDGKSYKYTVSSIDILKSDEQLRFITSSKPTLVLVTCYPFRYTGHAPQKYIVRLDYIK